MEVPPKVALVHKLQDETSGETGLHDEQQTTFESQQQLSTSPRIITPVHDTAGRASARRSVQDQGSSKPYVYPHRRLSSIVSNEPNLREKIVYRDALDSDRRAKKDVQ
ncbi:MAG: hypothetical protein CMJ80_11385 [Planctomycetaceae bacterium]|nr:hypothetical protein [Planctomycetaceae bacterium]